MKALCFFFLLVLVLPSACGRKMTPIPEKEAAQSQIYVNKCSECHALPHPKRHSFNEWEHLLALMKHRGMSLTADEERAILDYLRKHAR